jgi:hypothetical protein
MINISLNFLPEGHGEFGVLGFNCLECMLFVVCILQLSGLMKATKTKEGYLLIHTEPSWTAGACGQGKARC